MTRQTIEDQGHLRSGIKKIMQFNVLLVVALEWFIKEKLIIWKMAFFGVAEKVQLDM